MLEAVFKGRRFNGFESKVELLIVDGRAGFAAPSGCWASCIVADNSRNAGVVNSLSEMSFRLVFSP